MSNEPGVVRLSPWYLNTRRLAAATGIEIGVYAQTSVVRPSLERLDQMNFARRLAQEVVTSGKIPDVMESLADEDAPAGRTFGGIWGIFTFKGLPAAGRSAERGALFKPATFYADLPIGDRVYHATGSLYLEHVFAQSSFVTLSGKKRMYVAGQFDFTKGDDTVQMEPMIIGDLVQELAPDGTFQYRWPKLARVYPDVIDNFSAIANTRPPSEAQLTVLKTIPEEAVKNAFASIIGEPYVPKDWPGEKSDLYSARIKLDERILSAAFMFKGPAIFRPLHPANLGKQGDQLVRLFDEPAELLVLQHCHKVMPTVIRQMEALAVFPTRPRLYCVIDGADTYRILKAYGHLPAIEGA